MKLQILLCFLVFSTLVSTRSQSKNQVAIKLSSSSFNKAHPYYEIFKTKDADYIKWLYYGCVSNRTTEANTKSLKPSNNESGPLVFRIIENGSTRYDTIRNCVHPGPYEADLDSGWESIIPVYGKLPTGVWSTLDHDPVGGTRVALHIDKKQVNTKLEILAEDGFLVYTMADAYLTKGTHDFVWRPRSVKAGYYLLHTEVDGELMVQRIQVRDSWLRSFLSGFYARVKGKRAIRKYKKSDPTGNLPKGTTLSLEQNRKGTNLALSVPVNSEVEVSLLQPDGTLVKRGIETKESSNSYSCRLNDHISKTGIYLMLTKINGVQRTQKVRLKKQS